MIKATLFLCLLAFSAACETGLLPCGVFCYEPSQYTCTVDPVTLDLQLCGAGTTPCNQACIAECGSGLPVANDDDELFCPPDCSLTPGSGACGDICIDTDDYCCINEKAVPAASCPFDTPAASNTLALGCNLTLESTGTLWDGQLRLSFGPGAGPVTFTLTNGQLVDNRGQLCYISLSNQVQCNTPPQTSDFNGFGVTADGYLTYNNSARFFQCPVGTGGYNLFAETPSDDEVCTPVAITTTTDCPKPQPPVCTKAVDIAVVVDMSGSVSNKQFAAITAFTINFAASFDFGAQKGRMGLVWFGNTGTYKTNGLLADRSAFIRAANTSRPTQAQSSCVGCGLDLAHKMLKNNARSGVPQVLLLLSDGQSNVPQNTPRGCWKWNGRTCVGGSAGVLPAPNWIDEVTELRANPQLTVFSIGVVADGNLQESILKKIASPRGYLCVGAYDRLVSSVNKIRDAACQGPTPTKTVASSTTRPTPTTNAPVPTTKACPTKKTSIPLPWCYFDFDFDFSSGSSQCKDKSGNNRHGTHYGYKSGWGYWKQGAKCSGRKQYISVEKSETLSQSFSIATWVNITSSSESVVIAATNQWSLRLNPKSGKCHFTKGTDRSAKTYSWNVSVRTGSYFHLTFTVDVSGNALLYKDGAAQGSQQNCGHIPKSSGKLNLCYHDDYKFDGVFDDLLIFGKCLSRDEIDTIRNHNHCV